MLRNVLDLRPTRKSIRVKEINDRRDLLIVAQQSATVSAAPGDPHYMKRSIGLRRERPSMGTGGRGRTNSDRGKALPFVLSIVNRVERTKEFTLYSIVFVFSFFGHLPFVFGRYTEHSKLKFFSSDEYNLIGIIQRYQKNLSDHKLVYFLTETMDYSYGYPFYVLYSLATYPVKNVHDALGILAVGRLLSVFLGASTIVLVCMIIRRLGAKNYFVIAIGLAMSITPGMIIVHRPLSPDQLSNFFVVSAAAILLLEPFRFRLNLFVCSTLLAGAIAVKLSAALVAPSFALLILYRIYDARWKDQARSSRIPASIMDLGACVLGLSTFPLWNLPILLSPDSRVDYFRWLEIQEASNQTSHLGRVYYGGLASWFPIIDMNFGPLWMLGILLSLFAIGIIAALKLKQARCAVLITASLLWVIIPLTYILGSVTKTWIWYLALPSLALYVGVAAVHILNLRATPSRFLRGTINVALLALVLLNTVKVSQSYGEIAAVRWNDLSRPAYIEMEQIRFLLEKRLQSTDLSQLTMIVDKNTTLPIEAWRRGGAKIRKVRLPDITLNMLVQEWPRYVVVRLYGYHHHRGDRTGAKVRLDDLMEQACLIHDLCYVEIFAGDRSLTAIYEVREEMKKDNTR